MSSEFCTSQAEYGINGLANKGSVANHMDNSQRKLNSYGSPKGTNEEISVQKTMLE